MVDFFHRKSLKPKLTPEQQLANIEKATAAAKLRTEQNRALSLAVQQRREAQAKATQARIGLIKERLTPSPVAVEAARATVRGGQIVGRGLYEAGRVAGKATLQTLSRVSEAQQRQMRTSPTGDVQRYTLLRSPGYDTAWTALENAFGFQPFTYAQAIAVVTGAMGPAVASRRVNKLISSGAIGAEQPVHFETRPMGNITHDIFS